MFPLEQQLRHACLVKKLLFGVARMVRSMPGKIAAHIEECG